MYICMNDQYGRLSKIELSILTFFYLCYLGCGLTMVDIVVVLDSSESITGPNWPKMLDFTKAIFEDAEINEDNVRVGVLTYRHNSTVEFHLDDYHNKDQMFEAIDNVSNSIMIDTLPKQSEIGRS